jgi:sugar transferase (PEP-CTERM/EpsH1 system associated)
MATLRGACSLLTGGTLTESYYASRRMRALVADWDGQVGFDVIVAFSSSTAQYALPLNARRKVLDLCDLDSRKWLDYAGQSSWPMSWAYQTEARRLAQRERQFVEEFDATILITAAEARGLSAQGCVTDFPSAVRGDVHIVGNGVQPCAEDAPHGDARSVPAGRPAIVGFVGAMDYRPNVDAVCWFATNCWSRIHDAFPQAEFRIVGRSPTRRVRNLQRIRGITVTGPVADVSAEVRQFTISVAPLRIARGLQNKVLEAMAHGKPVVLTGGAAEGLSALNSRDLVVADDADEFARQVCRLLADPDQCKRLGSAARQYIESHHDWERELDQFEWIVTGIGVMRSSPTSQVLDPTAPRARPAAVIPAR